MRRRPSLILGLGLLIGAAGCGRSYLLPGHTADNVDHPPAVTLVLGERRPAFRTGPSVPSLWADAPEQRDGQADRMHSDDPGVVAAEHPSDGSADLFAKSVGRTRVYYHWHLVSDRGFEVTVVPR